MAILIRSHTVILNLVSIYRDFGITPAICKNEIEYGSISSTDIDDRNSRIDKVYGGCETNCDGSLLVFHVSDENEKTALLYRLNCLGFVRNTHIAEDNCSWIKEIRLKVQSEDGGLRDYTAVQHKDEVVAKIKMSKSESLVLRNVAVVSATSSWLEVNSDFEEYCEMNLFWKVVVSLLSLFKTKGKHVGYFKPYEHCLVENTLQDLSFGYQVLPGISQVVPESELELAKKFESNPDYLAMFD